MEDQSNLIAGAIAGHFNRDGYDNKCRPYDDRIVQQGTSALIRCGEDLYRVDVQLLKQDASPPSIPVPWETGPAQGGDADVQEGDELLLAARLCNRDKSKVWWHYAVCTVRDHCLELGGAPWNLDWSDVEWYVHTNRISPPESER